MNGSLLKALKSNNQTTGWTLELSFKMYSLYNFVCTIRTLSTRPNQDSQLRPIISRKIFYCLYCCPYCYCTMTKTWKPERLTLTSDKMRKFFWLDCLSMLLFYMFSQTWFCMKRCVTICTLIRSFFKVMLVNVAIFLL